jgi:hypothetical protein
MRFTQLCEPAERELGGATRFFRRHATAAILLYEQGEVRFQLLIEVAIQGVESEDRYDSSR